MHLFQRQYHDVYDGGNGQVLVEADGAGRVELSGWSWHDDWSEGDDPEHLFDFYGTPITYRGDYRGAEDESPPPIRFGLLTHLQYTLDRSRNGECDDFLADFDATLFCYCVAEKLIGSNAEYCRDWQTLQSLRLFKPFSSEKASVTYFSWPAQDRLEPQPSSQELKEEALRKKTRIYDKHGVELHAGDAVMWPAKGIRGIYQGYGTGTNAKGEPEVGRYTSVRTDGGKFEAIEVKAIANELEFVARGIEPSEDR